MRRILKAGWIARLVGLERKAKPAPRTRFVFVDEGGDDCATQRRALIASGEAHPNDRFVAFSWLPSAPATGEEA